MATLLSKGELSDIEILLTSSPIASPTAKPTISPTKRPDNQLTETPTPNQPIAKPSISPTKKPNQPTVLPTKSPTVSSSIAIGTNTTVSKMKYC